jgi:hypothetical protein
MKSRILFTVLSVCIIAVLFSCSNASVASYNVSNDATQFRVYRRVVFLNGITDKYILCVEGYCSILKSEDGMLEVIIKTEKGEYLKHFLGLSDNVTFFAEQVQPSKVSDKNYKVIFKPSVIVPDVEIN